MFFRTQKYKIKRQYSYLTQKLRALLYLYAKNSRLKIGRRSRLKQLRFIFGYEQQVNQYYSKYLMTE